MEIPAGLCYYGLVFQLPVNHGDSKMQQADEKSLSKEEKQERKEWIKYRKEDWKEQIKDLLEFGDSGRKIFGGIFDIEDAVDDDLPKDFVCPYAYLNGVIFPFAVRTTDLINHLPPYDLCPTDCDRCSFSMDSVFEKGDPNKFMAYWSDMKTRNPLPRYISNPNGYRNILNLDMFKPGDTQPPIEPIEVKRSSSSEAGCLGLLLIIIIVIAAILIL